jgi:hypothetical protein
VESQAIKECATFKVGKIKLGNEMMISGIIGIVVVVMVVIWFSPQSSFTFGKSRKSK